MRIDFKFAPQNLTCRSCDATIGQENCGQEYFMGTGQSLMLCTSCGLVYLTPDFTDESLNDFYVNHYRRLFLIDATKSHNEKFFRQTLYREFARLRVRHIAPHIPEGASLLELGSGFGAFLGQLHLVRPDIKLFATESDKANRDYLLENASVHFIEPSQIGEHGLYDVIVAFHVVEHLKTPVQDLTMAAAALKVNGKLIVEVPDINGHWGSWSFVQPAHLSYFSPASMKRMLQRAGVDVEYSGRNPVGEALKDTIWTIGGPKSQQKIPISLATEDEINELRNYILKQVPGQSYKIKHLIRKVTVWLLGANLIGAGQRYRYWKENTSFFTNEAEP